MNILSSTTDVNALNQSTDFRYHLGLALSRIRIQLLGGVVFGVVFPNLLQGQFERLSDQIASYDNTLVGTFCAFIFGYMIFRKTTALPGAKAITNVIPSFVISYGAVSVIFFGLRLDFSRYQFLISFGLVSLFFLGTLFFIARFRKPVLGIVSSGRESNALSIGAVNWISLKNPKHAEQHEGLAIVADLRSPDLSDEWQRYLAEAAVSGRRVFNARQLRESLIGKVQIENLAENTMGHLAPDSIYAPAKRYVDFSVALVGLIFLSPFLLLVAGLIRVTSAGPAIFKQERMGYQGRKFTVYKFRSMRPQDPQLVSTQTDMTLSDDNRITQIGRFIRKTRIDELPQLVNILRGEMSWIGPRPETLRLSEWYEREIPFYRYRHIVRPGITGWAQINQGHVTSVEDVRDKLAYDFYYVKNFSIWLDIVIVIQTIRIVFTGSGAK